ncbi:3-hydroxyacyl-thioester dehydratase X [Drechslerella dactyloides]|uniref:3-hydroxyacyl-thioester dehydratase X n=1 Tax=Drechslerella dactyloides TaxID=74499 RepID=A0AAD6IVY8_DREDA|nr:3-hydroxyacyl-thioester dehydratase X [Drechslerella dactyloides]
MEITILILLLFVKSAIAGLTNLFVGLGTRKAAVKTEMPKLSLSMPFTITEDDIKAYVSATGSKPVEIDGHRPTKALFLTGTTLPAMLLLLAKRGSPIQPLGCVNVRNTFEILRPSLCTLSALRSAEGAFVLATLESPARIVKRGVELDLRVEIRVKPEAGSDYVTIFQQVHTMLQFTKIAKSTPVSRAAMDPEFQFRLASMHATGHLGIGYMGPSEWARFCKDYNIIHTSGLAARLFGLPGKIAHGNHVVALMLKETLGPKDEDPDAVFRLEVQFRRPVTVPTNLDVHTEVVESGGSLHTRFAVAQGVKICVQGKYW